MTSFDWTRFLDLAKELAARPAEANQRSAVSRAYYAAFHEARRYLMRTRADLHVPRDGSAHQMVWNALKEGLREEKGAAMHGERLRRQRIAADYEAGTRDFRVPHGARRAIESAEAVIRSLHRA
jgi:uncharacterized protein (UPF0332 family)